MHEKLKKILEEMRAMLTAAGDENLTDEQQTTYDGLEADAVALRANIERQDKLDADEREAEEKRLESEKRAKELETRKAKPGPKIITLGAEDRDAEIKKYASRQGYRTRVFKDDDGKPDNTRAYRFGIWCAAAIGDSCPSVDTAWAQSRAKSLGIEVRRAPVSSEERALSEGVNTAGGFLVETEFSSSIIELVEMYGVFRQYANIHPMGSDSATIPRRTGGITAYFVGENEEGTESDPTWDQIGLVAKKVMALTRISSEVNEDAVISMADKVAQEIARAFSTLEDTCGFTAVGAQAHGGIMSLAGAMSALNALSEQGGQIAAANNVVADIGIGNFNQMVGLVPDYAEAGAAWYCSKWFWANCIARLALALGGNDAVNAQAGMGRTFLGYPVRFNNTMPKTDANSQTVAWLGDLSQAATMGTRRGMTISFSDSADDCFEKDQIMIKGTERFDINVHDIGTTSAAGPMINLLTHSA